MSQVVNALDFILGDAVREAPANVWRAAKRCLLDLIGVAAAGRTTESSWIVHEIAIEHWPPGAKKATLMFDGRSAGPSGAALAGAQTIDSIDAHDGYKFAKGHAGVSLLPGLLAVMEAEGDLLGDAEFLEALVIGYEIACRVATAQHQSCPDYHGSGSWNALGVTAIGARLLHLSRVQTREALGTAEYFGPRSQIMRGVDFPTMVKDSSNWGVMTGVISSYLAARGFTGAPPLTIESDEVREVWNDLGNRWLITEQYFKPWPTCRWAQPAVQAALNLTEEICLDHRRIREVNIETFHGACRLAGHSPTDTHQAQYAIAFPTACAFVRGQVGIDEIAGSGLSDQDILSLSQRIRFTEMPEFNAAFPGRRIARLKVLLDDGKVLETPATEPSGDPEQPLTDSQIVEKFHAYVAPVFGSDVANRIAQAIGPFDNKGLELRDLLDVLRQPYAQTYIHPKKRPVPLLA